MDMFGNQMVTTFWQKWFISLLGFYTAYYLVLLLTNFLVIYKEGFYHSALLRK